MKTIFDAAVRSALIARINTLQESNRPLWGKMNVCQMTKHCTLWNEWVLGIHNPVYKQSFLGKLFGKPALKLNTKDDRPMGRNMPAGRAFTIREKGGDLQRQKALWAGLTDDYSRFSNDGFIHDFFGKMSREQIGILAYKHADHHLRQFGV